MFAFSIDGCSELHDAIIRRYANKFMYLVSRDDVLLNIDLFNNHYEKYTPLHFAAHRGERHFVEELVRRGADCNAQNNFKETPLHIAICRCKDEEVIKILAKNTNLYLKNIYGYTPLISSIMNIKESGDLKVVKILLKEPDVAINLKDKKGWTALHAAVYFGHTKVVKALLSEGLKKNLDINARDRMGSTPLHFLDNFKHDYKESSVILNYFLKYANIYTIDVKVYEIDFRAQDIEGNTVLHILASFPYTPISYDPLYNPFANPFANENDVSTQLISCILDYCRQNGMEGVEHILNNVGLTFRDIQNMKIKRMLKGSKNIYLLGFYIFVGTYLATFILFSLISDFFNTF